MVGTKESQGYLPHALNNAQRTGGGQNLAHTAGGRLEQALRWLDNPGVDDGGVGRRLNFIFRNFKVKTKSF